MFQNVSQIANSLLLFLKMKSKPFLLSEASNDLCGLAAGKLKSALDKLMLAQTCTCQMASSDKVLGSKPLFLMRASRFRQKTGPFALTARLDVKAVCLHGGLVFYSFTTSPSYALLKLLLKAAWGSLGRRWAAGTDF